MFKMKETRKGSCDGVNVLTFEKGEVYDLPPNLARSFVESGSAVRYDPESEQEPAQDEIETKPAGPSETKPAEPDEEKEEPVVRFEPTSKGSSYYHFFRGEQQFVDADGEPIQVQGRDAAEEMKGSLIEMIEAEEE